METKTNSKQKDIGAIWVKESKAGNKFISMTVTIDGIAHKLVAFKNNYKADGSNQPDYRIFPSEEKVGTNYKNDDVL